MHCVVGDGCDGWVEDSDGFYDTFVMHDALLLGDDVKEDGNDVDHFQVQDPTADYLHSISSSPQETSLATPASKSCPCEWLSQTNKISDQNGTKRRQYTLNQTHKPIFFNIVLSSLISNGMLKSNMTSVLSRLMSHWMTAEA